VNNPLPQLQLGDALLYGSDGGFVDWAINFKTGGFCCHVEMSCGTNNTTYASRNGVGVGHYQFREKGLVAIRRPHNSFNEQAVRAFFDTIKTNKYDWIGLLAFYNLVSEDMPHRLFCSSLYTKLAKAGGLDLFNPDVDAVKISPWDIYKTPTLRTIWHL